MPIDNLVLCIQSQSKQKVEVVVKRDADGQAAEIDLVRVFSNMGKKKRIYAKRLLTLENSKR